jgi:hypothetical protein
VRLLLSHPDTDLNAVSHDGASILARVHRHYGHIESWYESINKLLDDEESRVHDLDCASLYICGVSCVGKSCLSWLQVLKSGLSCAMQVHRYQAWLLCER